MKPLLTLLFFFAFIAITLTANIEAVPEYTCHCKTYQGFTKQGETFTRDTVLANDFWYEKERFVYTYHQDTMEIKNGYAYCTDFWNRNLLPESRIRLTQ